MSVRNSWLSQEHKAGDVLLQVDVQEVFTM